MIKRLLSYLLPINIYKKKSQYSKNLEVTWNNGYLVLDSENTNYSFGSLQRVLKKGLKYIGYDRINTFESILILGVAGGSVIETLKKDIKFKGKITGVEIDANVIEIATTYFGLNQYKNVDIVIEDAFEFVLKSKTTYDLIVIDVFQDLTMPNFLYEEFFISKIKSLLNINGFILFNTMVLEYKDRRRNALFKSNFDSNYSVRLYPKIEDHNELFTIKKLN